MKPLGELNKYAHEKRWLNWRYGIKDGKKTKVPLGSSTDPDTWVVYEDLNPLLPCGIVFTPDEKLIGIDIDHCVKNGVIVHELKDRIEKFLDKADSYVEVSPSKTGLHVFLELREKVTLSSHKHAPFEAYTRGRFFTVTNIPFGESKPVRTVSAGEMEEILEVTGFKWCEELIESPYVQPVTEDILEKMFKSRNGETIKKLYEGDVSLYGGDDSSADMALCLHLAFWTGRNRELMERLWLESKLGQRVKTLKRKDYRDRTILKALEMSGDVYRGNPEAASAKVPVQSNYLEFVRSLDVKSRPISWLWHEKIARGKVTLIAGDPGLGKSQVGIYLAGVVSSGGMWPGGEMAEKGNVFLFSAEDDIEDTINPRLIAAGAEAKGVLIFKGVKRDGKSTFFDLGRDIELLERVVESNREISLVVIDPITAFLGDTDSHVNAEVRALLSQLSAIASKFKIAIVVITHLNKTTGGSPINKITGSLAFVAAARAAFMVIKDQNDERRRLFLPVKNNLAGDTSGYAFKIEKVGLMEGDVLITTSKVVWEKEEVMVSALDALRQQSEKKVDRRTVEWLENLLKHHPSGMEFEDILKEAMKRSISRRTLYRAKDEMFITVVGGKKYNQKIWKLDNFEEEDTVNSDEDTVNPDDVPI